MMRRKRGVRKGEGGDRDIIFVEQFPYAKFFFVLSWITSLHNAICKNYCYPYFRHKTAESHRSEKFLQ